MQAIMSSDMLEIYLSDIKTIFQNFDFDKLKKIIFMNADCFFSFLDRGHCPQTVQSGKTFIEIIEAVEPFIPLVINDDSLGTYLLTALYKGEEELDHLQHQFVQNAKVRFVKNIVTAECDAEVEEIFDICRTIRDYKEKSEAGFVK